MFKNWVKSIGTPFIIKSSLRPYSCIRQKLILIIIIIKKKQIMSRFRVNNCFRCVKRKNKKLFLCILVFRETEPNIQFVFKVFAFPRCPFKFSIWFLYKFRFELVRHYYRLLLSNNDLCINIFYIFLFLFFDLLFLFLNDIFFTCSPKRK